MKFVDLVRDYTLTTGTGTLTLSGAVPGFQSHLTALEPGDEFYYSIVDLTTGQKEAGRGTLNGGGQIERDPFGAPVNFGVGTKTVALTVGAEWYDEVERFTSVNAMRFGVHPDNSAAVNEAAFASLIAAVGGQSNPVLVRVPPANYNMGLFSDEEANIWFDFTGCVFTGSALQFATSPAAEFSRVIGGRFVTSGSQPLFQFHSSGGGLRDVQMVKTGEGAGYMLMSSADDNRFVGLRLKDGNGMELSGERLIFSDIHGVAREDGGDDFFAFKAKYRRTGDIVIQGVYGERFADVLAFGSEIGRQGLADPARTGRLENILARGVVASKCSYGSYIKPGGNEQVEVSYDWRDGLVRQLDIEIQLNDWEGEKLQEAIKFQPGRGSLIDGVTYRLRAVARCAEAESYFTNLRIPDFAAYAGGAPTVKNVEIILDVQDPNDGAAAGGSAPAHPPKHFFQMEKANLAYGTIENVELTLKGRGCGQSGVYVGEGLDDVLTIKHAYMRNACADPAAAVSVSAGVATRSRIRMPGENDIVMPNSTYKPIRLLGTGDVVGKIQKVWIGDVAAGVSDSRYWKTPPCPMFLRKLTGINAINISSNAGDYITFQVRALGTRYDGTATLGDAMAQRSTNVTGMVAGESFDYGAFLSTGATAAYLDRYLSADARLLLQEVHVGSGRGAAKLEATVHYVQLGPLV